MWQVEALRICEQGAGKNSGDRNKACASLLLLF
jgi:hypothetical protein